MGRRIRNQITRQPHRNIKLPETRGDVRRERRLDYVDTIRFEKSLASVSEPEVLGTVQARKSVHCSLI